MNTLATIEDFLAQKRIAFVGLSRNSRDFSREVFRAMKRSGYDLVPVNPDVDELEGEPTYASVADIPGEVDAALLMTPSRATAAVVEACVARGIQRIWMHRGLGGGGSVSADAVALCEERGIRLTAGECPLMYLEDPGWVHRVHAWFKKRRGTYPAAEL